MIEIRHVSHQFEPDGNGKQPLRTLDNINTIIPDATFVSFLGPSGCGKTTLLRIVDGLIRATTGDVVVDGKTISGTSSDRAMVFQEFNLLPWRTVAKNIELGLEVQGIDRSLRAQRVGDALKLVGLEGFRHHYPHELSGGMKQLVGFARAYCTNPRYLLMDEPFGSLDPQIREMMQLQLMRIWETDRKTVIFVTHSVEEAVFLSDRIVVFSARPARIRETVDICLPRPRSASDREIKGGAAFIDYRQRIWGLLQHEMPPLGSSTMIEAAGR